MGKTSQNKMFHGKISQGRKLQGRISWSKISQGLNITKKKVAHLYGNVNCDISWKISNRLDRYLMLFVYTLFHQIF